jgi:glycosyltransferase involved in cell wall biosynthesis
MMNPIDRKIIVVMPAYNPVKTLKITYDALPRGDVAEIILVDDGSRDEVK